MGSCEHGTNEPSGFIDYKECIDGKRNCQFLKWTQHCGVRRDSGMEVKTRLHNTYPCLELGKSQAEILTWR